MRKKMDEPPIVVGMKESLIVLRDMRINRKKYIPLFIESSLTHINELPDNEFFSIVEGLMEYITKRLTCFDTLKPLMN